MDLEECGCPFEVDLYDEVLVSRMQSRSATMSGELGPIEIMCDAPTYAVVEACAGLGFSAPSDVRWCRIDRRYLNRAGALIPQVQTNKPACACGHHIPKLERFTFTFVSGKQARYHLGQCIRCRAIYWDSE